MTVANKVQVRTTARQWLAAGQMMSCSDLQLFVRQSHNAAASSHQTLLLIHGFPTASWDWHRIWDACCQQFARVVAIDMPGFGFSDKPRHLPYSIAMQADVQEQLLAQLDITSCHLLVHDYGVSVAQELLARQLRDELSFRIKTCVFLNGGLFHGVHRPLLIQKCLASPLGFLLTPLIGKAVLARSMRRIYHQPPAANEIEQMWTLISHHNGQRLTARIIRYLHERKQHQQRWLQALQQAGIPLRLIVGLSDPISGANIAAAWRQRISADTVDELENVGHYPQLEAPEAVLRACSAFWNTPDNL
jgi:pimeloyl-ACP methyl ester carboxylesterase